MEATRSQESFEGNMVQIEIATEEMNESAQRYKAENKIFRFGVEMDQSSRKIVAHGLSSEHETVASEIQASGFTDIAKEQEKSENLRPEHLESKPEVQCAEENGQVLITEITKSGTQSSKEPGLAERVQGHAYNMNWKLLGDAYHPKNGNISAYWNELIENDTFKQESPLGNTVLHVAARNGNDKLVEKIVRQAPNLLTAKNCNGDTPLHVAAKAGHLSTLEILVAAQLSKLSHPSPEMALEPLKEILEKNKQGNSFFHEALVNGDQRVRTSLVSHDGLKEVAKRASLHINNEMKSALYLAIEAGNKEVVEHALAEVIPHGPNYVPEGKSPLLAAITKRDEEGRTPLHYAASIGYLKGVQYLLGQCHSCAMERDIYGYFPLHLASYGGHVKVVKELLKLEHCPDPRELLDNSGRNILHLAAKGGKFDVVKYILQATNHELEKMINDQDADGNTPLHLATLRCHPKIVHALTWDKRVDVTLVNGKGQTALDIADPPEKMFLRQELTWLALLSAPGLRLQYGKPAPSDIIVPPQSTPSFWEIEPLDEDPYRTIINTLMVVSTLIVTVTFAAGFTMPGGTNSSGPGQGMALMRNRIWFKVYIFCITISMYGAISVTIILIWAFGPWGDQGGETMAFHALRVARVLLGITLATLSMAFLAGLHLVISDLSWVATSSMIIGWVFIFMLLLLYTLLWFPSTACNQVVRYLSYYPFILLASATTWNLIKSDSEEEECNNEE